MEHGVTGVRFPVGEPDGLADAVNALLQDPMFAQSLASKARADGPRPPLVAGHRGAHRRRLRRRRSPPHPRSRPAGSATLLGNGMPVVFVPPGNLLADPPTVPVGDRPGAGPRRRRGGRRQAGASAAREAIRTEGALWLDAAEREAADRAEAARAAAAPVRRRHRRRGAPLTHPMIR